MRILEEKHSQWKMKYNDNVNIYDPKQRRPSNEKESSQKDSSQKELDQNQDTKCLIRCLSDMLDVINMKDMKHYGHRFY